MNLRKKKGFTIIELVIVIAVIGILTAVLVPTFINLTNRANEAADNSLVKNLNTALAMEAQTPGHKKPSTMQGAIDDLENQGYLFENLISKSGQDLLWDQEKNEFALNSDETLDNPNYWQIVDKIPTTQRFSYYAGKNFKDTTVNPKYGFDAGENTKIATVNYSNNASEAQNVNIRTNGGTLIVTDTNANSEQVFYGYADSVEVTTGSACFTSHGTIGTMNLKAGKATADSGSYVGLMKAAAGTQVEEKNGGVFVIPTNAVVSQIASEVAESIGYTISGDEFVPSEEKIDKSYFAIYDMDSLEAFRTAINNGVEVLSAKVTADFDITGAAWRPIGTIAHPFYGTFDGQGHTIDGLCNDGYIVDQDDVWTTETTGLTGSAYGFFGIVGSRTGNKDVTIKNVKFTNVDFDVPLTNALAVVAGADVGAAKKNSVNYAGNIIVDAVEVSGVQVKGVDSIGAIIGKSYTTGNISVTNCVTDITVKTEGSVKKLAGIVGFASKANSIYVKGNTVKGNVILGGIDTSKNITGARNYVNMTVVTGGRFGKNFVFGDSVNTITGKMYVGTESLIEYLDPFTLSYEFNNKGEATKATFNYILAENRQDGKSYLDNNLVSFYDGSYVNNLRMNVDGEDDGKADLIDNFGNVTMENCIINKATINAESNTELVLKNCTFNQTAGAYQIRTNDRYAPKVNNDYIYGNGHVSIYGGTYNHNGETALCGTTTQNNVTVYSGTFKERYVAHHLPGANVGGSYETYPYETIVDGIRYTANRVGNMWVVTNEPVLE